MEFYVHLRSCAIACAGSFGGAAVGREWFNGSCFGLLAVSVEAQLWLCALISHFLHIIYLAFRKGNNFHLLLLVLCNLQQKWQVKFITLRGRHKNRSQSSKRVQGFRSLGFVKRPFKFFGPSFIFVNPVLSPSTTIYITFFVLWSFWENIKKCKYYPRWFCPINLMF